MRIAFDPQVFLQQEFGGISRYIVSLARHLLSHPDVEAKIFAPIHYNQHLAELSDGLNWGWRVPRLRKTARFVGSASEFLAKQAMKRFRPDIVHETYYSRSCLAPEGARRVITVYDMVSERFVAEFGGGQFTDIKKLAISRAHHVVCISESTRRDLVELFDVAVDRTSVVYLGYDDLLATMDSYPAVHGGESSAPYLLYVGSRGGYKNFRGLIRAFADSPYVRENFSVMCFGGGAFTPDEFALFKELKLGDEQVQQVSGTDRRLASMYKHAAVFAYPSLYEGFGIPPLEAMSLGCPVICSDTSSIPEVVGTAGEYFDPGDRDSIKAAMEAVLLSPSRRSELIAKGHARRALFSWERCARETLDIYRSIL